MPTAPVKAPAARVAAAAPAAQAAAQTSKLNPDGSETVEDAAGDSGAHNALLAAVASTVAAATPTASAGVPAGPTAWQEGVNYTRIVPGQPTDVPAGQVEVLEFFWYACPHCFALEPMVEAWKKSKPSYITFVPRAGDLERWTPRARPAVTTPSRAWASSTNCTARYSRKSRSTAIRWSPAIRPTRRRPSAYRRRSPKRKESPKSAFKAAYHSMGVEARLQRADELVQRYRIDGVPTFVVNGKYLADVRSAGGPERLLTLVSDLAAQEHKH